MGTITTTITIATITTIILIIMITISNHIVVLLFVSSWVVGLTLDLGRIGVATRSSNFLFVSLPSQQAVRASS